MTTTPAELMADCIEGVRKSTSKERDAVTALAKLSPRLFAAPKGYSRSSHSLPKPYDQACVSQDGAHLQSSYTAEFVRTDNVEEKTKSMKLIQDKMSAGMKAGEDIDQLVKEMHAALAASGMDDGVELSLQYNRHSFEFSGKKVVVPGGFVAYQRPLKVGSSRSRTIVLFGALSEPMGGGERFEATFSKGAPEEKIHNVLLTLDAPTKQSIEWLKLAKLDQLAKLVQ